jgi:hypothetical protein
MRKALEEIAPRRPEPLETSERHIWSVIRPLDPEDNHEGTEIPLIFATVTALLIWGAVLYLLHAV